MSILKIDGETVITDENLTLGTTISIADIEEPGNSSSGYTKTVEIPINPHNMRVFGFTNELYSKERFNDELHTAEYESDGVIIMRGVAQIEKITSAKGSDGQIGGSFHVTVIGAAHDWVTRAKKKVSDLTSDEYVTYEMSEVYNNSIRPDPTLVKFFPVDRGAFWKTENETIVPRDTLDIRDYHPFLNAWKLMELIFGDYTIKSSLQPLLEKLYTSGYIPKIEDLTYIKEENDFFIGTSVSEALCNGSIGFDNQSIGINMYDSWQSDSFHNNNGVITQSDVDWVTGVIPQFTPTVTATMRLETNLNYKTKITNGSTGIWLDILSEPGECLYIDKYQQIVGDNIEDVILTLDMCEEAKHKMGDISHVFIPASGSNNVITYLVYLEYKVDIPEHLTRLIHGWPGAYYGLGRTKKGKNWFVVRSSQGLGEVGFHQGMVGYRVGADLVSNFYYFEIKNHEVTFNINGVVKNAYTLQEGNNYPIYGIFSCSRGYGCSPNGHSVDLFVGTNNSIKPIFANTLSSGNRITPAIIGGDSTQLEFLSAMRQMFNLLFYTNPVSKEVFIEPRTSFYNLDRNKMVDWRDRIDLSKPIEVTELGGDVGNALKLAYADGNDVVQYHNWKMQTELGAYETPLLNKTTSEPKEIINPIYSPFLLRNVESVGMTLLQEKPEKTQEIIDEIELNITPVIGYSAGIRDRIVGGDIAQFSRYPLFDFFRRLNRMQLSLGEVNLGFDNKTYIYNGKKRTCRGLNKYYSDTISAYNQGRRVSVQLRLMPYEVEAILTPNSQMRDLRAVFLLQIDGEDVPCILECISDYNPESAPTKCQFIVDPNIRLEGEDAVVVTYEGTAITRNEKVIKM